MIGSGQNECLRAVQLEAMSRPAWSEFVAYCHDRELGLRRQAFGHLNHFISTAKDWSLEARKEFVNWLCSCLAKHGDSDGYGLIPQPLTSQIIEPTLQEWMTAEAFNSVPCRWAGMFFSGVAYGPLRAGLANSSIAAIEHLREALIRDPADEMARIRIIELLIGDAEFNCHHLPDYYIGNPDVDLAQLVEARSFLQNISNESEVARLQSEIEHVSQLIGDWVECAAAGEQDFDNWCRTRGRCYKWIQTYYYSS